MGVSTHVPLKAPTGFFAPVTASCRRIWLVWNDLWSGDRRRVALGRENARVRREVGRRAAMVKRLSLDSGDESREDVFFVYLCCFGVGGVCFDVLYIETLGAGRELASSPPPPRTTPRCG